MSSPIQNPQAVIYEVTLLVEEHVAAEFQAWLIDHVGQILLLDGFESAQIWRVEGTQDGVGSRQWCVQYHLQNRAALDRYFEQHAAHFRADGVNRFGSLFSASRRILSAPIRLP